MSGQQVGFQPLQQPCAYYTVSNPTDKVPTSWQLRIPTTTTCDLANTWGGSKHTMDGNTIVITPGPNDIKPSGQTVVTGGFCGNNCQLAIDTNAATVTFTQ